MNSLLSNITSETIDILYKEAHRKKNKKKLRYIINTLVDILMESIQPYMYSIMALLVILFLMNCFQFFYYVRLQMINKQISIKN
jgi:hypothetical protein